MISPAFGFGILQARRDGRSPSTTTMHRLETQRGPSARTAIRVLLLSGVASLTLLYALDALQPGSRGFLRIQRDNVDSICYFANAHSLLFDRDFDLSNQFAVLITATSPLGETSRAWIREVPTTGRPGSPYALGYSLLGIPPLALGTLVDLLVGRPADGYGPAAVAAFVTANLVWLHVGLAFLYLWLVDLGVRWDERGADVRGWALACAGALVVSTALGYYVVTVMSHTASFAAVAFFLWTWDRCWTRDRRRDWLLAGIAAGCMALCRWQEALFLLVPLIAEAMDPARRRQWLSVAGRRRRILATAAAGVAFFPQMMQWRSIYGEWWLIPQGSGYLAWPPRWVGAVLFSSWNGLFFTTPATLLGAAGLLWAIRRDRARGIPLGLTLVAQVALLGSIPSSWHGYAFAQRNLIGSLPVLAAGWLFLVLRLRRVWRTTVVAGIAVGAVFTLLAAVQWRFELIPRRDRLTFEEAFVDKLRLRTALARDRELRAALEAEDLAETGRLADALERVRVRYPESRVLLRELEEAYRRAGLEQRRSEVERRLNELADRRLF